MSHLSKEVFTKLNVYNGNTNRISHSKTSDLALENKFIFFRGFDVVDFSKGINWNYKHKHTVATYQVYLHCLHIVKELTDSYLVTNDERYVNKANKIIMDWASSDKNQTFYPHNSSWKDHSAASRMKNIIYFQQNTNKKYQLDDEYFDSLLMKHCEFLSKREFYSENNHGMMSDEGLLFLSCYLNDNNLSNMYSQTAILRMERIILKLFSGSSYNLENSPEYHRLTQNLSTRFIRLVDLLGCHFDNKCRDIITKSYERNKVILKPDNTYPLIGDTGLFKAKITKSFDNFIDYQAGVVYLNSENKVKQELSSYFTFKAGYQLKSHKHRDDLSLTYMHKGEDIFIDSGKYTYDRKNPMKPYIVSPVAHSTIYKINETYTLNDGVTDNDKLKLKFVYENDEYTHIASINHLYDKIKIYRDIIYFEDKGLIIVDRCFSDEKQFMGQNFNLAPDIDVEKISGKEYYLKTSNNTVLIMKEHNSRTLSKYFNHSNSSRGFYSEKFNQLLETHQIEYRQNSMACRFVTSIMEKNGDNELEPQLKNNKLIFKLGNTDFDINLQSL